MSIESHGGTNITPSATQIRLQFAEYLSNHQLTIRITGDTVTVIFADGKKANAKIVGTDPRTDLAVIKAEGVTDLAAAKFGDSSKMQVGDTVLALGSPLGLEGSVVRVVERLQKRIAVLRFPEQRQTGEHHRPAARLGETGDGRQHLCRRGLRDLSDIGERRLAAVAAGLRDAGALLGDDDPEFAADIAAFRAEEVEHRDSAREAGAARAFRRNPNGKRPSAATLSPAISRTAGCVIPDPRQACTTTSGTAVTPTSTRGPTLPVIVAISSPWTRRKKELQNAPWP